MTVAVAIGTAIITALIIIFGGGAGKPKQDQGTVIESENQSNDDTGASGAESGVSPEEEEEDSTEELLAELGVNPGDVEIDITEQGLDNCKTNIKKEQEQNAAVAGDPVRVATGEYILDDYDIKNVTRTYMSKNQITGSFGYGWYSNIDEVILVGSYEVVPERILNRQNELEQDDETEEEEIQEQEIDENIESGENSENGENENTGDDENSDDNENNPENPDDGEGEDLEPEIVVQGMEFDEESLFINDEAMKKNQLAVKEGMPSYYYKTAVGFYTYVDGTGSPHLFVPGENDGFYSIGNFKHEFESLTVSDNKYELKFRDGTKKIFNAAGLLVEQTDRNNNYVIFSRNADGQVEKIITNFGDDYIVTYKNNLVSEITKYRNPDFKIKYKYNLSPDGKIYLSSVTDEENDTVRFAYANDGMLSGLEKSDGSVIKIDYDEHLADGGRIATSTTNEAGYSENFTYDTRQKQTVYKDHDGNVTVFKYDDNYNTIYQKCPDGTEIYYSYDGNYNCVSEKMNGDEVTYSYDSVGNRTECKYSDGSVETWTYDENSLATSHTNRDGVTEIFERDENGNISCYSVGGKTIWTALYDKYGLVKEQTIYGENATKIAFEYDLYGNLLERKTYGNEGDSRVEKYLYDSDGRVTRYSLNDKTISSYEYTKKSVKKIDYNGKTTVYTTNNRKDLTSAEEIDTTTDEVRITRFEYDRRHLPIKEFVGNGKTEKLIWEKRYTPAGLLLAERVPVDGENYILVNSFTGGEISSQTRFKTNQEILNFQTVDLEKLQSAAENVFVRECKKTLESNNKSSYTFTNEIGQSDVLKYDEFGNAFEYQNQMNEIFKNQFSRAGKLVSTQTDFGGIIDFEYDEQGRIKTAGEKGKEKILIDYNNNGSVSSSINRYGEKTDYGYNSFGLVTSISSPAKTEWYDYDEFGRLKKYVVGKENNLSSSERYTVIEYSDDGRTAVVTEGGLYKSTFIFNAFGEIEKSIDGNGNEFSFGYDENGNRILETDGYGNTARYEYNNFGLITKLTGYDGNVTRYYYDDALNLRKISDDEGVLWQGEYDKTGRLVSERGRPGVVKEYEYDSLGRVLSVKTGDAVTERYDYSEYGREVTFTDGNGSDYHFYKDEFGRTVREKNRLGKEQGYFYDAEGTLSSKRDFNGNETKVIYEDGGRTVRYSFYDGTESVIKYDMTGNIVCAKNVEGEFLYEYNKAGKLVALRDVSGGDVIRYTYDKAGNKVRMASNSSDVAYSYGKNGELKSVADYKQRTSVNFFYDKAGRETKRVFGNGGFKQTFYDKAGRTIAVLEKDARGNLLWAEGYAYDSEGRQSAKVNESGAVTLYEYDRAGHVGKVYYPLSESLAERQKSEAEENGLYTGSASQGENRYIPSALNATLNSLLARIGGAGSVPSLQVFNAESYEYDGNNNLVAKITAYGKIEYRYDAENRLVSSGAAGSCVTYSYDANGNLLERKSAAKTAQYRYNAENRMIYSETTDESRKIMAKTGYGYDALGRRTTVSDMAGGGTRTLYDGFTLDAIKKSPTYANGRYIDGFELGVNTSSEGQSADRYYYNAETEHRKEKGRYAADDGEWKIASDSARYEQVYLSVGGSPAATAQIGGESAGGGAWYYGTDIQGSVRKATDGYGEVIGGYDYDLFGNTLGEDAADYGYCGKSRSRATGLYDYGFRDYDAAVGRFTSMDPVRDGVNWFAYCGGDAVNWVDLWGLNSDTVLDNNVIDPNDPNGWQKWKAQQEGLAYMEYLKNAEKQPLKVTSTPTTILILRQHDKYGNEFDSQRFVIKGNVGNRNTTFQDMCGNNCKDAAQAEKYDGITLPDGIYHVETEGLSKQSDGTWNSASYKNVLRLQTDDINIPKEIREKINNDFFLVHGNVKIGGKPTNTPGSAGCAISNGGQAGHDLFMEKMMEGVTDISSITIVISSLSNKKHGW